MTSAFHITLIWRHKWTPGIIDVEYLTNQNKDKQILPTECSDGSSTSARGPVSWG